MWRHIGDAARPAEARRASLTHVSGMRLGSGHGNPVLRAMSIGHRRAAPAAAEPAACGHAVAGNARGYHGFNLWTFLRSPAFTHIWHRVAPMLLVRPPAHSTPVSASHVTPITQAFHFLAVMHVGLFGVRNNRAERGSRVVLPAVVGFVMVIITSVLASVQDVLPQYMALAAIVQGKLAAVLGVATCASLVFAVWTCHTLLLFCNVARLYRLR